jgi:hypothetical protein
MPCPGVSQLTLATVGSSSSGSRRTNANIDDDELQVLQEVIKDLLGLKDTARPSGC